MAGYGHAMTEPLKMAPCIRWDRVFHWATAIVWMRFFAMVWTSIALVSAFGFWVLLMIDMKLAPQGWLALPALVVWR